MNDNKSYLRKLHWKKLIPRKFSLLKINKFFDASFFRLSSYWWLNDFITFQSVVYPQHTLIDNVVMLFSILSTRGQTIKKLVSIFFHKNKSSKSQSHLKWFKLNMYLAKNSQHKTTRAAWNIWWSEMSEVANLQDFAFLDHHPYPCSQPLMLIIVSA